MMTNLNKVLILLGLFTLLAAIYGSNLPSSGEENMVQDEQRQRTEQTERVKYTRMLKTCLRLAIKDSRDHSEQEVFEAHLSDLLGEHSNIPLELEMSVIEFLQNDILFARDLFPKTWSRYRRLAAEVLIHTWQRISASLDKDFDTDDKPFINLAPPRETGLPSGVAPKAIKDPILRKKYEQAIADNAKKAKYYSEQSQLRMLDKHFSEKAERYLREIYTRPPVALDELVQLLDPDVLGKDTVERLLASVRDKLSDE